MGPKDPERFLTFWAVKCCPETTKTSKIGFIYGILDSRSDLLVTFGLKVRQLVDLDEVGTFGVEDAIFQLDDEVEEGVDGANELDWKL